MKRPNHFSAGAKSEKVRAMSVQEMLVILALIIEGIHEREEKEPSKHGVKYL